MKNMKLLKTLVALGLVSAFLACAAIPLHPNAHRVIATKSPAPKGCKFLGAIVGSQGDFLSGGFTSNKNMAEGAMNDLRNKAAQMNANYVQLETDRAGVTGSYSSSFSGSAWGFSGGGYGGSQQTDVTLTGNAYYCEPALIGLE